MSLMTGLGFSTSSIPVTAVTVATLGRLVARATSQKKSPGPSLQAYLHRTTGDHEAMAAIGAGVRLVKGAYNEPPEIAMPKKADVDASFLSLAKAMLAPEVLRKGLRAVFGTHDTALIASIRQHAAASGVAPKDYEFHMLYGIQRAEQLRLAKEGAIVRVLIAYGSYWFAWYMRRLAERPANVWFGAKSMFS